MEFKGLFWNVRGLADSKTQTYLKQIYKNTNADMVNGWFLEISMQWLAAMGKRVEMHLIIFHVQIFKIG